MAKEASVLRYLDVPRLLTRIDSFYWRGRVLETLLRAGYDEHVPLVAGAHPGELIFAIRRTRRADLLPVVRKLVDENPEDPEVLAGGIQTFGLFGYTDEMLRAGDSGRRLMAERQRRLCGLGRQIAGVAGHGR